MDCVKTKGLADDDIWDDTLLIKAYDESVKLAKEQLAKRIAESTNNKAQGTGTVTKSTPVQEQDTKEITFKVGDYVRATYVDGIDYEAKILSINEGQAKCLLKYVGYENEQQVDMRQLVPSWGKKARRMQFMQSKQDPESTYGCFGKEKKTKVRQSKITELSFGTVPPPPPMPPMLNELTEDSEHISAMLMSWYLSGYYTGLYHGRKISSRGKVVKK